MEATLVDPLTGDRLGLPMVGIVDLLIETNDGPLLVDFKTAARGGHPIEQQHEIQLACYAALFRELSGSVEAGLEMEYLFLMRPSFWSALLAWPRTSPFGVDSPARDTLTV